MFKKRLIKPIEVVGKDYFGLPSKMIILPKDEPGWYWKIGKKEIPLTPHMLKIKKRRVAVSASDSGACINIFEHIGALRAFGLDGIAIATDSWPPYDGCARILWEKLKPHLMDGRNEVKWRTVPYEFVGTCSNTNRYTKIKPNRQKQLDVTVVVNYPSLGEQKLRFVISDTQESPLDESILSVGSQGWPRKLYYLSKTVSLLGWPHHNNIVWPQKHDPEITIRKFAEHRMLDVLGGLSLLFPQGDMLSATIISHCSGHEADVEVVKHFANRELTSL